MRLDKATELCTILQGYKNATILRWLQTGHENLIQTLIDKSGLHTLPQIFLKTNAIFQANLPEAHAH